VLKTILFSGEKRKALAQVQLDLLRKNHSDERNDALLRRVFCAAVQGKE